MARTPFKLKSGNSSAFKEMGSTSMSFQDLANKAKDDANKLHDNLQVIGSNVQEFKQKRKDVVESKRLASEDKKTNFQRRADERKEQRKTGESKFQADVRKRKEKNKAKKADKYVTKTPEQQAKIDPKSEIKGNFSTAKTYTYTDAGDSKPKSTKTNKKVVKLKKEKKNKYDDLFDVPFNPYIKYDQYDLEGNPIQKKSPSKKRGYKTKRKK